FVASVEAPEATRSPEMVAPTVEPVAAAVPPPVAEPEPAPPPEPTGNIDASWPDGESSAVGSQPVPPLAAPPVLDESEPEAAALAARAECALLACNGSIEG